MAVLTEPHPRGHRLLWLDVARGCAILAMFVYHVAFDLVLFGFVDWPVDRAPVWRGFAAGIASTFLFLTGVSLVYAHAGGIRWRAFWRRFMVIAACAFVVTVATVLTMPAPIYFGILHAIATFSILALPFLSAPVWVIGVAALVVMLVPLFAKSELFASPIFYPLGLAPQLPYTFDYEPVFPWLAPTLLGVMFARVMGRGEGSAAPGRVLAAVSWAGRHSLVIYLLHQPVFFAALLSVRHFINPV